MILALVAPQCKCQYLYNSLSTSTTVLVPIPLQQSQHQHYNASAYISTQFQHQRYCASANISRQFLALQRFCTSLHAHPAYGAGPVQEPSRPGRGRRVANKGEFSKPAAPFCNPRLHKKPCTSPLPPKRVSSHNLPQHPFATHNCTTKYPENIP